MSCSLSYGTINKMQAVYLENSHVRIGILPDRGSDIFEFYYKPKNLDFLLRLSKGIQNPNQVFSQIRSNENQFEDYYYGGWQVCLPNSPAFNYRGAELGQHGEVSLIPWNIVDQKDCEDEVSLTVSVQPLRIPILVTRTFKLQKDSAKLQIEESVKNISKTHLDIMWGQHIAFGLPFLEEGVSISTNANQMITEPSMPEESCLFRRGEKFKWPMAESINGEMIRADRISAFGTDKYSDLCYLTGMGNKAFYSIKNEAQNVGMTVHWDGDLFKELWLWQERLATQDAPWWGDCYTVALEPWTSRWTNQPNKAIENGEWLKLEAGQEISTEIAACAFENDWKNE